MLDLDIRRSQGCDGFPNYVQALYRGQRLDSTADPDQIPTDSEFILFRGIYIAAFIIRRILRHFVVVHIIFDHVFFDHVFFATRFAFRVFI